MRKDGVGELVSRAVTAILDKKGLSVVALDLRGLTDYADALVIASGTSDRHVMAIGEAVVDAFGVAGERALGVEGMERGHWILIDYGDIVVHVFHEPVRALYDLEGLWTDATRLPLELPAEALPRAALY
ncbi:MAG TPA: ribosome silencing factor [Myxococcota bacterium]|jgi:ribosome-associated protein|nr:ribosome silencing factor [Myxococcota bacterium]